MTGTTIWFTGLSGSGKSTICQAVYEEITRRGLPAEILDGDDLRKNLTKGLGFTKADRDENVHRIGMVARLLSKHGVIVLVAAISPYRETRDEVRKTIENFIEVYVSAPIETCEGRDPKGLYAKVRAGELWNFTGVDDPYEIPIAPDIECRTDLETVEESTHKIMRALAQNGTMLSVETKADLHLR
jgi:adenylylsulfate kinase